MSNVGTDSPAEETGRPPATLQEHVTSNCRPHPAIPAVLAFFLLVLMPAISLQPASPGWVLWGIAVGIVVSCGLAVAAGFCSFAPQVIWIALALWAMQLFERGAAPGALRQLLIAGIVAAALMIVVQAWRVATGRFVPTIVERPDEDY